jgi:hypothetical protein
MAGYSSKTLIDKLGLKPEAKFIIINPPAGFINSLGLDRNPKRLAGTYNYIHFFSTSADDLERKFPLLKRHLAPAGMLWISWPKKSAKLPSDLGENAVMRIGLANGLVDVKVAAVDDVWSGLKFVYRLKDRK